MNLGLVLVTEVPEHEDVAVVAVAVGRPLLTDGDAIDALDGGVLHDDDIVELHPDVSRRLEHLFQVLQVLGLGLLGILQLVA